MKKCFCGGEIIACTVCLLTKRITEAIQQAEQRGREKNWELEQTSRDLWNRKQGLLRSAAIIGNHLDSKKFRCICSDDIVEFIRKEANDT